MQTKSESQLALSEDSLDRSVRAFLPNHEKCAPPCYRGDCAWITGYPEVIPLNKLSTMWARSPSVVSEATAEEELRSRENVWRSLLIQRLEGSRWRLRRTRSAMGFELDFGLEVS